MKEVGIEPVLQKARGFKIVRVTVSQIFKAEYDRFNSALVWYGVPETLSYDAPGLSIIKDALGGLTIKEK